MDENSKNRCDNHIVRTGLRSDIKQKLYALRKQIYK